MFDSCRTYSGTFCMFQQIFGRYLQATPEGQPLYADSIESLVRNKIQAMKIDMANEVIDAGRFDMQTSMAERRETLEQMLQVPSLSACVGSM